MMKKNPKFEARNSKQILNSKFEKGLKHLNLYFKYCFAFRHPFRYSIFGFVLALPTAHAADPKWTDIDFPGRFSNIEELVVAIITWLLGFGGALAVLAIIYSGIMYIMAGGDPTKAEAAKKNLVWAITGLVVVLLAFVIITWVGNVLSGTI